MSQHCNRFANETKRKDDPTVTVTIVTRCNNHGCEFDTFHAFYARIARRFDFDFGGKFKSAGLDQ